MTTAGLSLTEDRLSEAVSVSTACLESGTDEDADTALRGAFHGFRLEIVLPALVARLR